MEQEEQDIILMCIDFAQKADELENKGFHDRSYQENGFVEDFNTLFDQYAYGKQNRTLSGLNFQQPPRYASINSSSSKNIEHLSKARYQVTFLTEPKWQSIRFLVDKKAGAWKITRFETYLGIANHGKDVGEEIWRKHKL